MEHQDISGYELSRNWFDWCFENPDIVRPVHTALYFFSIEHCNRLGWKEKFGLPTQMAMDAIGVKNWRTYSSAFEDIVKWGFFKVHERSKNQYSATVIAIVKNTKANTKALSKATQKHLQKQSSSIAVIDKQYNKETIEPINNISVYSFDEFWDDYDKKEDRKKCEKKWKSITDKQKEAIRVHVPLYVQSTPDIQYRKNPSTYLNNECWNNEIIQRKPVNLPPPNYNPTYERWDGKKRWSGSVEIPYDAPPKPSNVERWDNEKQKWVFSNF
jgi:hypothetical protein